MSRMLPACFCLVLVSTLALPAGAASKADSLQLTHQFLKVLNPDNKCEFPKGFRAKAGGSKKLEEYYAPDYFLEQALGKHVKKFNKDQLGRYKIIFRKLLETKGIGARDGDRNDANCTIVKDGKRAEDVHINLEIEEEDFEVQLTLHWRYLNGGWRISDMSIDESSMLKNYQNQFARVIKKVGIPGFIEKLEAQLKKLEAKESSKKG